MILYMRLGGIGIKSSYLKSSGHVFFIKLLNLLISELSAVQSFLLVVEKVYVEVGTTEERSRV